MSRPCEARPMRGRTALITGAGGSLGRAAAVELARRGAAVVLADKAQQPLEQSANLLCSEGASVLALEVDVTREEQVERLLDIAAHRFGRIDMLFNNAGIEGLSAPIHDYPLSAFDEVLAVNVRGMFLVLKHAIRHMRDGGGSIVNCGSTSGLIGNPDVCAYVASKHAVVGLTRAAAADAGPFGIRVNCVAPGPLDSAMMERIELTWRHRGGGVRGWYEAQTPLGRYGNPEELASFVSFLLSDEASFISGGIFPLDGGLTACGRPASPQEGSSKSGARRVRRLSL